MNRCLNFYYLNVQVNNMKGVEVFDAEKNLTDECGRLHFIQTLAGAHVVEKLTTRHSKLIRVETTK